MRVDNHRGLKLRVIHVVNNKTRAAHKTCHRNPIRHGSFIFNLQLYYFCEIRTDRKLDRQKRSQY